MGSAIYLYCVVHAAAAPSVTRVTGGIPGAGRLTARAAGRSLWVLIAEVPLDVYGEIALQSGLHDMKWVGQVAMAHERIIEQVSRQRATTVVPMKLFTMFSSADRAVEATKLQAREIRAVVKRIAGCEEWGVRITRTPQRVRAGLPLAERSTSGAAFLAARKQARDSARDAILAAAQESAAVYGRLASIAREAVRRDDVPEAASAPPLLDAAFLVPAPRRATFKSAARRQAAKVASAGAELTLSGPWPPYNFVQTDPAS
jgi:hypothetical protein